MIQKNYTDDTEKIVMSLKMSLKHQNRVAENVVENTQFMKDEKLTRTIFYRLVKQYEAEIGAYK